MNRSVHLGSKKPNGEGATPALLGIPGMKLICNAKQHEENILLALKTCANSPSSGKWHRLMFWCYFFRGSAKSRFPFFHIPLNGRKVNGVRERRPFLNVICFLACRLFRMPMPDAAGEFVRGFPCSKLKNKRTRPQGQFCLETLLQTRCLTITIQQLTKNYFLSTTHRKETQTSCRSLLVAKLVQSK